MRFLVRVPTTSNLEGKVMIATGSGLNWSISQINMTSLMEDARRGVHFENAQLKIVSEEQLPALHKKLVSVGAGSKVLVDTTRPFKGGIEKTKMPAYLVYGSRRSFLWVDTAPYAASRFITCPAVVVQDIRDAADKSVYYILALTNGQVITVKTEELLAQCELYRQRGVPFVQNMQYVSANGSKAAHMKNYDGKQVPIYRLPANNASSVLNKIDIIIQKVLIVDVPPATVLDSIVTVKDADKVTPDSVIRNCDACISLLKQRLSVTSVEQLTVVQRQMIDNLIRFIGQFPVDTAKTCMQNLIARISLISHYLSSTEFSQEQHKEARAVVLTLSKVRG